MDVETLRVIISGDATGLIGAVGAAEAELTGLQKAQIGVGAAAQKAGKLVAAYGVATTAVLVKSAKDAGQLNKELANIGTLSVPTERLKEFKVQIQDVAIATGKSTSDISEGTYQVISAFGDAADTMEKVEINAKAAKAGLATTADSINLTSAVTKAYGDTSAAAVQKVADLAFKTVELGQTTFPELAQSMQQVTSESKELGVSQEELFAVYATLTGVTGNAAEVQTQLKAIYTALLKPSDNMTTVIKKLGYNSGYAMINTLGLAGTLDALTKATDGSQEALLDLFVNQRAIPAALALTGAQADTFIKKLGKMEEASGAATKAFEVQTEGVAKTGFTLEQAQVKMQVASQRFGESAAPIIADFADLVDKAADALANLSDGQREAIVKSGVMAAELTVLTAVGSKLFSAFKGGAKLIKTLLPSAGEAAATGGTLAGLAPTLTSIASAAGPVALAVAGIGAAALVAKKSYDAWYNSNYQFAEGLDEQAEKLLETRKQWKSLNDLRWEYNDLTGKINSNSLEGEELESAKSRLDEIVKILKDEYKIDVDSGDIDEAIEKAQKLAEMDALKQETALKKQLDSGKTAYDKAVEKLPRVTKEYKDAEAAAEKYRDAQDKIAEYDNQFANHEISETGYLNRLKEIMKGAYGDNTLAFGGFLNDLDHLSDKSLAGANATQRLNSAISQLGEDAKRRKMDDLNASIDKYKQAAEDLSNINLDNFTDAINAGADGTKYLDRIAQYAKDGLIDADEFAKKAALITAGQESVNKMFEQGDEAVGSYVTDYVSKMQLFGASNEQIEAGLASLAEKYTEYLQNLEKNPLPKDQHVEFTADGKVIFVPNTEEVDKYKPEEKPGTVKMEVDDSEVDKWSAPPKRGQVIYEAVISEQFRGTNFGKYSSNMFHEATGTQYFGGGLAMVNDQKGVSDPRELIVDKGRAFIPEGRDVVLPLSKGAKVYTAAQTKRIMAGLPHYASGVNNSDEFTAARDDWTHYTRTHAVTTTQEFEKWVELSEKFKGNEKDIADIEEQIYSLRVKIVNEQNKASQAYLDEHNALNDWDAIGDSAIDAFRRIQERNKAEVDAGRMTWDEYSETMSSVGSKMYNDRIRQSEKWLAHEAKYNGMSTEDYLAGIDRMRQYTEEYYAQGLISHKEYIEGKIALDEKYMDTQTQANADEYAAWQHDADAWQTMRSTYEDWDEVGDSEEAFLKRRIERIREFYEQHKIGFEEFIDDTNAAQMDLYKYQKQQLEDALGEMQTKISDMRTQLSEQEQALRDSWTVADRKESIADLTEKVRLYSGAVTERGKEQLKQYQEQLKQAQREEELYQLQQKNNAIIEEMEAQYKLAEDNKKVLLRGIRSEIVDAQDAVNALVSSVENPKDDNKFVKLLQNIETAINNIEVKGGDTNYNDNRKQTTTVTNNYPSIGSIAHGNWNVMR